MTAGIFTVFLGIDAGIAIFLGWRLLRAVRASLPPKKPPPVKDLPTVSVCIPARNERHAMTQCLERVLASDYKKLEIIVFDDSSDDETSVLIRSFAHAGVRFVPGAKLPSGWLGKNHALDILAQEASGEYLIFMDVDTFIAPTTITRLLSYTKLHGKTMLSVLPSRNDVWRSSVFLGSLRYFWQLVLTSKRRPTASGALWLVQSEAFLGHGGLRPYRAEVQAELHIAKLMGAGYQCLVDDGRLGVSYEKKWSSQVETARRLLYPSAKGWRFPLALCALVMMNLPFITVLTAFFVPWHAVHGIASGVLGLFVAIYGFYVHIAWRRNWWFGALLWPLVILQELALMLASAIGYWRHTITWKGRPVAAQVVQANSLEIDQ